MLRRVLLCLLLVFLAPLYLAAQDKAVDLLIISSHSRGSEWEQGMLPPLDGLVKDRPDLTVSFEHFPFISFPSVESLESALDNILDSYTVQPRLVILLGGSCFSFAPDLQKRWPGIPMLLIGEQDYYVDLDYTLHGPGDPLANRYPLTVLRDSGYNLTLISTPSHYRRTMEMIFKVQPNLEKIFFIAGENYLIKERQWRIEQYLAMNHPEVAYQAISPTTTSTDQLLAILEQEGGPNTAVYFGSWLIRTGYHENASTRHNTVSLIEHIAPVYTLFRNDLEKHPYQVGYFSYSQEEYDRTVLQRIQDVLDNGLHPSQMPFSYLEAGFPTLNYRAMEHFGLDTSLIPDDAQVVGAPKTFWQAYKKQILWALTVLLILVFVSMTHGLSSLKKARNMAQKASNLKSAFIQNMSHEVRTPLNAITGFSQLLCLPDGYLTEEEKQEYMSYILNNSHLLTVLVNDLLSMADMENGQYPVQKAPTNLNEVARQAIKSVETRIPPGVELVRQPGLDEDARYVTDGTRVQQILINFLTNACKHTTKGQIVIGNSLTENPGYITFYVADTGTGVPKEEAENIFDRFVKLDQHKQGAGLGLSICRLVAQSLGGRVWLDTAYTNGARFVLTLPMRTVEEDQKSSLSS
ncbi:MAG: HAMP domain-containing histidine kinase [Bacteroidales bacterium]|nr:HAMP domain-containing histidine kinase [Bacteroidales bacterium]